MSETNTLKRLERPERDHLRPIWFTLILGTLFCLPASPQQTARKTIPAGPSVDTLRIRLQVNPHDAKAHRQLVEMLRKKWLPRALVMEDATWIKNNPSDYRALTELVTYAKTALDDPEFAIEHEQAFLLKADREQNDLDYDRANSQVAEDLDKRGRSNESLRICDELVRLNPDDASLWADRSYTLMSLGKVRDAIQSLRHSLQFDPSSEMVHELLADALVSADDLEGAETEYRAAVSIYQAKYKNGETTSSFDDLIRALVKPGIQSHTETVLADIQLKLARALMLDRKWEAAIAATEAALEADNKAFISLYLRAQIYDMEGSLDQAVQTRKNASIAIEKQATSEFSKLPQKDRPQVDPRVIFLTDALWNKETGYPALPSEILSILEPRAESLSPYERLILSSAYFALKRVPDAKVQWERAVAMDSKLDTAKSNANFGRELLKSGDYAAALRHLRRAYELDPQNMTYRIDLELAQRKNVGGD